MKKVVQKKKEDQSPANTTKVQAQPVNKTAEATTAKAPPAVVQKAKAAAPAPQPAPAAPAAPAA